MSWPKAGPGRPRGSPNRDKPFKQALMLEIAAAQAKNDPKSLRNIAKKLMERAADGDTQAIKEIADRVDGKVAQAIAGDDGLPPVSLIVTGVVRAGDAQD